MSLKYTVVLVWVIYLCYKVVITGCEVVLVNRNVTDSFRFGKDGCTNDERVCTSSATCQSDGSCLCSADKPNFRNPATRSGVDKSYGCLDSESIRFGLVGGSENCSFGPFQLLPYSQNKPARKFSGSDNQRMENCYLFYLPQAKFPNNATEIELQRFEKSDVDLNVSNNDLYFKWKRSVPNLKGTIITFSLQCVAKNENARRTTHQITCLRAKVLGTWSADAVSESTKVSVSTEPTITSTKPKSSQTTTISTSSVLTGPKKVSLSTDARVTSIHPKSLQITTKYTSFVAVTTAETRTIPTGLTPVVTKEPTTSALNSTGTMLPTTSTRSSEISSRDGDSSSRAIIVIAVLAAVTLLIILVAIIWCLCKRKKRYSLRKHSSHGSSCKEDGSMGMKQFNYTESNLRGPDDHAYATPNVQTESTVVKANSAYETPDSQFVVVEANPAYEIPDNQFVVVQAKPANEKPDSQSVIVEANPAYEKPDNQRVIVEANPVYEKPDSQSVIVEANPAYETSDSQSVVVQANPVYETPDSQSVIVQANPAYEMPESQSMVVEANPAYETPDSQSVIVEANPAYETPDSQSVIVEANPAYETPDSQSVIVEANPAYETPDNQSVVVEGNPAYETPDSQRVVVEANPADHKSKEANIASCNPEPGYESVDMKKRVSNDSQVDPVYATPDVKKREVDRVNSYPDPGYELINRVNSYPEPGYETPDFKKKEINAATAN
ncbi:Hypothetical predicted protein [Paramuricea clavata]|uniref:Uncharacterized protein n=1 Tax=Paramuricea clavata TaxID=317549 RepID=A0A6S7J5G4_PARCT|nr:Hypothetical predicted protein [Paramuricea clavata]